jgi:DNA-nicking Smr family endonuclease
MTTGRGGEEDGDTLWDAVKKTVVPLRKSQASRDSKIEKPERHPKPPAKRRHAHVVPAQPAPRAPSLPPLAKLDRRARNRISRGSTEIEGRLDLHGYKLAEAKERLVHFLERAQAREKSLVLVITGKGTAAPHGAERGVLKREVPMWLGSAEFRPLVIGFEEAASFHGGAGALYVRVRRKR